MIAGNIATGKTQLLSALGDAMGLPTFPERWMENPWFDADLRAPLLSQAWFLLAAGSDHARLAADGGVQERSIHENAHVFARELLAGDDLRLLEAVYERLDEQLPQPTLLVHLTASPEELLRRVRRRARPEERTVTVEYLTRLSARYRALVDRWTRCPVVEVDTERIDVRTDGGLRHVLERASERLA